jgi:hypothetical protein
MTGCLSGNDVDGAHGVIGAHWHPFASERVAR